MGRFFLIIFGIAVGIYFVRRWLMKNFELGSASKKENDVAAMVRCSLCNVHVLKGESIELQGKHYCSKEHLRQAILKSSD